MENKGVSKALWIIAIVLVIFLIGGIVVSIAPTAPAEVTVTTGEVTDHDSTTSIKVTLEGEKDSYALSMTGPEGTEVGSSSITETQMADGEQSVWVALIGAPVGEVTAKPGAYSLVVTDSSGNKVYEKTLGPYSGSDLSIINIGTTSTFHEYIGYHIKSILLTVKNGGDLPAYVTGVDIKIDTITDLFTIPEEKEAILPGETATITASPFITLGPLDEGDYSASFKLKEGFWGQGKTVATYTTTISIAPTVPAEVTVTTGEVTDHNLITSIKVTLEGEKDSYALSMTGPEGTEVGSAFITETQMVDGKQSVWVALVGDFRGKVTAKPGAYSLVVTDSSGNKVYGKTFGPYSGSDLSVINIGTTSTFHEYIGYDIKSILLTVKNDGDLPAYVTGVDIKIDTTKGSSTIPKEKEVILPGETATITLSPFIALGPFDEGDYSASFKLKEGFLGLLGGGKTVATYTTTISIP